MQFGGPTGAFLAGDSVWIRPSPTRPWRQPVLPWGRRASRCSALAPARVEMARDVMSLSPGAVLRQVRGRAARGRYQLADILNDIAENRADPQTWS